MSRWRSMSDAEKSMFFAVLGGCWAFVALVVALVAVAL